MEVEGVDVYMCVDVAVSSGHVGVYSEAVHNVLHRYYAPVPTCRLLDFHTAFPICPHPTCICCRCFDAGQQVDSNIAVHVYHGPSLDIDMM